jgi:hypothetical protein
MTARTAIKPQAAALAFITIRVLDLYDELTSDYWTPEDSINPWQLEAAVDEYLTESGEERCADYNEACELAAVLNQEHPDCRLDPEVTEMLLAIARSRRDEYLDYEEDDCEDDDEDCQAIDFAYYCKTRRVRDESAR